MPYAVEITLADPPSAEGEDPAMYRLPETFTTLAEAREAAAGHVASLGRAPGTALFTVTDGEGVTVLTQAA